MSIDLAAIGRLFDDEGFAIRAVTPESAEPVIGAVALHHVLKGWAQKTFPAERGEPDQGMLPSDSQSPYEALSEPSVPEQ